MNGASAIIFDLHASRRTSRQRRDEAGVFAAGGAR
jgi:hypothetical protein